MQSEIFAKPCVGAIIERVIDGEKYVLIQTRWKSDGGDTNGKIEIPAGKIREYENIFEALRREVYEETGLTVTTIRGESSAVTNTIGNVVTVSFEPYCITQNLSGAYSIILNTFICEAVGEPLEVTDETRNIGWIKVSDLRSIVEDTPELVFFMHINSLRKYLLP
jgi:8-oxo-dGTP diphosphatase